MEGELATCRRRVNDFLQALQASSLLFKPMHPCDQILDGAPEPIEAPHHERVTFTHEVLDLPQPRAISHGTADPVDNDPFTTRLLQGVLLKVEMLLVRGDACVSDVHKEACQNVKKRIGNQVYLNVVFLLGLLPQFGLTRNRKRARRPQEKKRSFSCPEPMLYMPTRSDVKRIP